MESDPLQQVPLEEPVILKSIDEQIEEEERARGGTIKITDSQLIQPNGADSSLQASNLKFNEAEEEKGSQNINNN